LQEIDFGALSGVVVGMILGVDIRSIGTAIWTLSGDMIFPRWGTIAEEWNRPCSCPVGTILPGRRRSEIHLRSTRNRSAAENECRVPLPGL
jgi:hypothetical protein